MLRITGLAMALGLASCGSAHERREAGPANRIASAEKAAAVDPEPIADPAQSEQTDGAAEQTTGAKLPADVVAFRERRDECDHFRGEDPYDAERAAFLSEALARTCTGTDAELKALRARYAANAAILAALADYEDEAE
ncbi:hypothetical protein LK533_07075 [Sphingomonas sp. PL-96]|uniref:hypothetical protein n=1 Tax=Sphingomonas sp. PL-96 TaxID=2887201 RepID=UPI001E2FAE1B|nr:hypothetical protein [Sphingomonas sp. PL-96]MCC2976434.1 hypothetical protein [Sphingomonas sp. PL-96]